MIFVPLGSETKNFQVPLKRITLMKKLLLLAGLFVAISGCSPQSTDLTVFSYNVRLNAASDGINYWDNRKEWVAQSIEFFEGDLIGAQEVTYQQLKDLDSLLPAYDYIGVGRKGGNEGEFSPIFYLKDRFKVQDSATFWLSETPEEVGSVGWDAALPRIVTWASFEDTETGKSFFHFNTHFDHRGREARTESAELILRKIQEIAGDSPVVLTGDFNIRPEEEPYEVLLKELEDTFLQADQKYTPGYTFNAWNYEGEGDFHRIDYIFYKGQEIKPLKYHVLDGQRGKRFISDHFPVIVKFSID